MQHSGVIFSDLEEVNCYSATPSQSDQRWISDENKGLAKISWDFGIFYLIAPVIRKSTTKN